MSGKAEYPWVKESERIDKLRKKYKNYKFKPEEIAQASADARIKAASHKYYGYHQGYKVNVQGVKYPRAKGHFYATSNPSQAIKSAIREKETGKEQYDARHRRARARTGLLGVNWRFG